MPADMLADEREDSLLALATIRLAELFTESEEPASPLDAILKRLFDPREQLTVSAFASSL